MTEQELRQHRCCFTGHRPEKLDKPEAVRCQLKFCSSNGFLKSTLCIRVKKRLLFSGVSGILAKFVVNFNIGEMCLQEMEGCLWQSLKMSP